VAGLNAVAPYDWAGFLRQRLDSLAPSTPVESVENSGWKLVYNEQPNEFQQNEDTVRKRLNLNLSIGMVLEDDGTIGDVIHDGPSYQAGIAPGMKITAVEGHQFTAEGLKDAIDAAKSSSTPIQLIIANGVELHTYSIDYHGGLRYAHLERNNNAPDYLSEIYRPLTP
jgi:predicted metalloprotease with PDZ domain